MGRLVRRIHAIRVWGPGVKGLAWNLNESYAKEFESASSHQTVPGEQPQQHCI